MTTELRRAAPTPTTSPPASPATAPTSSSGCGRASSRACALRVASPHHAPRGRGPGATVASTTTGAKAPWLVAGRRLVRDHGPIDCGPAGLFRAGTPHRLSRGHGFEAPSRRVRGIRKLGLQVLECLLMHGRRIPEKGSRVQKVDCFQHGDGLKPPKIAPPLPLKWRGSRGLKPVKRWRTRQCRCTPRSPAPP